MIRRSRHHLTAWLGLIAMWLVVVAPSVSQLLASAQAHEPVAALCSTLHPGGQSDVSQSALTGHASTVGDSGHVALTPLHLSHDDAFGACGYCHLFEHHVAMTDVAQVGTPAALELSGTVPPALSTGFAPPGAFPSGRPRDPPALS